MVNRLICAVFCLVASAAYGQTVQLITAEEAKLPSAATKPPSRAITRGPGVKLASPENVSGNFAFKVAVEQSKIQPPKVILLIAKAVTPNADGEFGIERAAKRIDKLVKAATPAATGAASIYAGIKAYLGDLG